ncbi:MAG: DNA topoisomerase [Sphingomonas sp. SCN 67-18]|uniref:DNA topoisomerase IB n=1 Tax=uncultured Sphingomonas sp. TaxID=158754 RepID=UPI00086C7D99|nr:DNA topoisomerase IB [Sphingomonas sp. SCN 67-18]ODU20478.1 MAG: DNA topoisomerase [Sphingomonas sp. SCN 67-18]
MPSALVYVDDALPGITRRRAGKGWIYHDTRGDRIVRRDDIDRLNRIALPPAYRDAWFCPSANGHIQATGHDERGRKQYRYHPDFRARRDAAKYDRCAAFGRALPLLRARVDDDLAGDGFGKERAVAAVVRLLDLGRVRVGNEAYAKANGSFGATTLRKRHAVVSGRVLKLKYRAKSGRLLVLAVTDASLARFVRRVQDLPEQHLFSYLDESGAAHPVSSSDVNAYIREAMGDDFTAKHFRTWAASAIAFEALIAAQGALSLKELLDPVAAALGNTPAISRKSYVHPALIERTRSSAPWDKGLQLPRATKYLTRVERGLAAFLDEIGNAKTPARAA